MPNSVKKPIFPQETDAAPDAETDDFGFGSLDELASFMVDALTIPLPTDFRNSEGAQTDPTQEPAPKDSKRLN